jgi:hypothetical protein
VRPGGTVTTTGAAATAIAAGLLAQGLVPAAAGHPGAAVRVLVTLPADDGADENAPRARYRLPPISTASTSAPDAAILTRREESADAGAPRFISSPPRR